MTSAAAEAAFEQATYDAIIKLTFTRITECPPSKRGVDTLRKKVEHAMIKIKCPPVILAYSAAGLISANRPNLPAQSQCGHRIFIMACSTSFRSVSTLRLDGGHSVILVKVILMIAS